VDDDPLSRAAAEAATTTSTTTSASATTERSPLSASIQSKSTNGAFSHGNSSSQCFDYTVQKGDTLRALAVRYHTTVNSILQANKTRSEEILLMRKTIKIPSPPSSTASGARHASSEDDQVNEIGSNGGQRLGVLTMESDAAYLLRSTNSTNMDEALAFVREHIGMTMIEALSQFKKMLIEKDQRRAQEIADTLLSTAASFPKSGCIVTSSRTSYQYMAPGAHMDKIEMEREARAERMSQLDDSIYQL